MYPEDLIDNSEAFPASPQPLRARFLRPREQEADPSDPPSRLWIQISLFLATLFTTTFSGALMQYNFSHNLPFFDFDHIYQVLRVGFATPGRFLAGLPFSLTLLTILMAHEMGHYLACVYYGVDASLPYFLPSPVPVTGTFGAFIRIHSPIYSKRVLFDIGIAGPLAGFIFLVPALGVGLAFSKILPGINHQGSIQLGVPLLEWAAQRWIFPGVPAADIYLHPVGRAAWVGMFATALNLLPVGQLDGGHVVHALFGGRQKWVTYLFLATLVPLGRYWPGWWFWGIILFLFARNHPPVEERSSVGSGRIQVALVALVILVLCFSVVPMQESR